MNAKPTHGIFLLSLDFEMGWGLAHRYGWSDALRRRLAGVRQSVELLLDLLAEYEIHCTWATVGLLFCQDAEEALACCSPLHQEFIGSDHLHHVFRHFSDIACAPDLLRAIQAQPHQEIAGHTFSHCFPLSGPCSREMFREEILASQAIASSYGVTLRSFVFPRNEVREDLLEELVDLGIRSFRGPTEHAWYLPERAFWKRQGQRLFRLLDREFGFSGLHLYDSEDCALHDGRLMNFPGSRLYQPKPAPTWRKRGSFFSQGLLQAAREKKVFHLWFHPHNLCGFMKEGEAELRSLFALAQKLQTEGTLKSRTMEEYREER